MPSFRVSTPPSCTSRMRAKGTQLKILQRSKVPTVLFRTNCMTVSLGGSIFVVFGVTFFVIVRGFLDGFFSASSSSSLESLIALLLFFGLFFVVSVSVSDVVVLFFSFVSMAAFFSFSFSPFVECLLSNSFSSSSSVDCSRAVVFFILRVVASVSSLSSSSSSSSFLSLSLYPLFFLWPSSWVI